jgi:GNAT superfamily N-acetyltransferase
MVKFRRTSLNTKNLKLIKTLQKTCLPYDSPYLNRKAWYWIGYWRSTPVAFCVLAPSIRWADCVYLARAGVVPEFQGRGLQKRMITIREKWARKHGYKWAITDTSENPPSANSLISRGYRLYEPTVPWGLSRAIYWRKKL